MRPTRPRVKDKWEASVNSCGPRHPEWETSVGDKWKTSVDSYGPRHPECETSVGSLHLSSALVSHSGCLGPHRQV